MMGRLDYPENDMDEEEKEFTAFSMLLSHHKRKQTSTSRHIL